MAKGRRNGLGARIPQKAGFSVGIVGVQGSRPAASLDPAGCGSLQGSAAKFFDLGLQGPGQHVVCLGARQFVGQ